MSVVRRPGAPLWPACVGAGDLGHLPGRCGKPGYQLCDSGFQYRDCDYQRVPGGIFLNAVCPQQNGEGKPDRPDPSGEFVKNSKKRA